jgi:hypothetical protein
MRRVLNLEVLLMRLLLVDDWFISLDPFPAVFWRFKSLLLPFLTVAP